MKPLFLFSLYAVGLVLVFILATNISVYRVAGPYIYDSVATVPSASVALIPGAAVFQDGTLSSIFESRVDRAIELYQAGKVLKILVSGDNSTLSHNEVNPVRVYLIGKGIPDQDIFLDHAGFDTYSSMYRARDIFGVSSVIISTQSFHLTRAVFLARRLGMEAYGVSADVGHTEIRNYAREVLANEKVFFDLLMHREPKYLGEKIPIMADGRNYP